MQLDMASYLSDRLKLAVSMINQFHHSTNGLRGIKVVCQRLCHAGFRFRQPEGMRLNCYINMRRRNRLKCSHCWYNVEGGCAPL